jgi:hypothetical protein
MGIQPIPFVKFESCETQGVADSKNWYMRLSSEQLVNFL